MTALATHLERLELNRRQTLRFVAYLRLLARHEARESGAPEAERAARLLTAEPHGGGLESSAVRPIGWHLAHVAAYEEGCFGPSPNPELWAVYHHDSRERVPVDSLDEIVRRLDVSRRHVLALAAGWSDALLPRVPPDPSLPGMPLADLLESAAWHEPHHLNLANETLRAQYVEG